MQALSLEKCLHSSAAVLRRLPWVSFPALFGVALSLPAAFPEPNQTTVACANDSRGCVTSELAGTVTARSGTRLRLVTDLGNVTIHAANSSNVSYRVHLEADASQKDAQQLVKEFKVSSMQLPGGVVLKGQSGGKECSGRLWVTMDVYVPATYSLEVSTGGGNIVTDDVGGRATLTTTGGNITTGNIRGSAHLQTRGGHILVKNVAGDLTAETGGGHIAAGTVGGNAWLHTIGGHIRVTSVAGLAHLETGGGNVALEHSGAQLVAETSGGQIDVGDAAGIVRAKTDGGGIRLSRVSGPTNLDAPDGSIYLTQVDSAVQATTHTGGITAWFVAASRQANTSEFSSGDGDIVVYLPRDLPVTIDARIQKGTEHHVIVDPAFPLKMSYDDSPTGSRSLHAQGALNGGGELVRLRTVSGDIHVVVSDMNQQIEIYKQQMQELQHRLESQLDMR
jgi:Putative adhesin